MVKRRGYLIVLLLVLTLSGCFREASESTNPLDPPGETVATNTPLSPSVDVSATATMLQPITSTPVQAVATDVPPPTDVPLESATATLLQPITSTPVQAVATNVPPPTAVPPTADGGVSQPEPMHTPSPVPLTPGAPPSSNVSTATPRPSTTTPIPTPTDISDGVVRDGCIHIVTSGENLFRIALNNGATLEQIKAVNPRIDAVLIQPGDEIILPNCGEGDETVIDDEPTETPEVVEGGTIHIVVSGETLLAIARRYGVSSQEIIAANDQFDPDALSIGQRLFIPLEEDDMTAQPTAETTNLETIHTVQSGETLGSIAQLYGVTIAAIISANPDLGNPNKLSINQELIIPPVKDN